MYFLVVLFISVMPIWKKSWLEPAQYWKAVLSIDPTFQLES